MRLPQRATIPTRQGAADPFAAARAAAVGSLGDEATELARQLAAAGISPGEIEAAHAAACGRGQAVGALSCLHKRVEKIVDGTWRSIVLPWRLLTMLALPLLPGNFVVCSGTVGSSKTFLLVQLGLHLLAQGIDYVTLGVEGDREGYLLRALAQISGVAQVTKPDWVAANPDRTRGLLHTHAAVLREFSRHLVIAGELGIETQEQVIEWAEREAQNSRRIVMVDPVTLIDRIPGMNLWDSDLVFAKAMKRTAETYQVTVWVTTHPVKGSSEPSRENMAGGVVYERNSDCILTLGNHDPKVSSVQSACGTCDVSHNRTLGIAKSRHGPGTGTRLAFDFDPGTLTLIERGVIVKKKKGRQSW